MNDNITDSTAFREIESDSIENKYQKFEATDEPVRIKFELPSEEALVQTTTARLQRIAHTKKRREELLFTALQNLQRKDFYNELSEKLEDDYISEDDFYQELEKNENKYTIELKRMKNPNDIFIINEIVKKLIDWENFTVDYVADLFSIDTDDLKNSVSLVK